MLYLPRDRVRLNAATRTAAITAMNALFFRSMDMYFGIISSPFIPGPPHAHDQIEEHRRPDEGQDHSCRQFVRIDYDLADGIGYDQERRTHGHRWYHQEPVVPA